VEVVGLDQSTTMLAHARTKAVEAGVNIEWIESDFRRFELRRKFRLIFIAFNSVQHLHDHASLASLFANVRSHLAPGGHFVFDVFNPSIAILGRDPSRRHLERQYEDPDGRGMVTLETTAVYDDAAQVNHITCYFSLPESNDFRVEQLHLRCFFPQELDLLVRTNGFEIEEKFGNFARKAFTSGDMKQVVVCKKQA
jgi:SAM-dependent methyltransferase